MKPVATLVGISKVYNVGGEEVHALRNIDLTIGDGEYIALLGPSGSGKSTLMNIVGCLDRPTHGSYVLNGETVESLDDSNLARIRSRGIGFVFQSYNLIPRLSALENIERALIYRGIERRSRRDISQHALERVGLADRLHHLPSELSGGQKQRVAIARALSTSPEMLIADEPTGSLDSRSADQILAIFGDLNRDGTTIMLVTHDQSVAERCERRVVLYDGQIVDDVHGHAQG